MPYAASLCRLVGSIKFCSMYTRSEILSDANGHMREALATLETLRAAPSEMVERSKPIRVSVMFGSTEPGGA